MAILKDIRGLFSRSKPVAIDLSSTQASGLADGANGADGRELARHDEEARGRARDEERLHEMVDLAREYREQLEAQTQHLSRVIEKMDRLPASLGTLPEFARKQDRLLELLQDHLERGETRGESLREGLDAVVQASARQTDVLGLIQQQLDLNQQATSGLNEHLEGLRESLDRFADSYGETASILREVSTATEVRESAVVDSMERTRKWMFGGMVACVVAALAAVGAAAAVFVQVLGNG